MFGNILFPVLTQYRHSGLATCHLVSTPGSSWEFPIANNNFNFRYSSRLSCLILYHHHLHHHLYLHLHPQTHGRKKLFFNPPASTMNDFRAWAPSCWHRKNPHTSQGRTPLRHLHTNAHCSNSASLTSTLSIDLFKTTILQQWEALFRCWYRGAYS